MLNLIRDRKHRRRFLFFAVALCFSMVVAFKAWPLIAPKSFEKRAFVKSFTALNKISKILDDFKSRHDGLLPQNLENLETNALYSGELSMAYGNLALASKYLGMLDGHAVNRMGRLNDFIAYSTNGLSSNSWFAYTRFGYFVDDGMVVVAISSKGTATFVRFDRIRKF